MYGRGNYGPPFGQGLQRPLPPYQQQPPGMHFQQGRPFPPPQAGFASAVPAPLGSAYPRPPFAPPATSQQGLPPPPPPLAAPGRAPLQHPYMSGQQNYSSGTRNQHHAPPHPPSSVGPSQVPPPPPPCGQTLYGQPVPPPQQGMQNLPLPPPPPPTATGLSRPPNIDPTKQSLMAESQMSSVGPQAPPLPPSSPPRPPPPPCSSSPSAKLSHAPVNASVSSPIQSGSSPISDKVPVSEFGADVVAHGHNKNDAPIPNEYLSQGQTVVEDLPPPPPKPVDEKVVRNIEVLCQFIAKNGPGFEEMACQKESGNPDFEFLFGGEPGSEASCAREYYMWMKKKYGLVSGSCEGEGHMTKSQTHADSDCLVQPNSLTIIGATHSAADSDVDMEG